MSDEELIEFVYDTTDVVRDVTARLGRRRHVLTVQAGSGRRLAPRFDRPLSSASAVTDASRSAAIASTAHFTRLRHLASSASQPHRRAGPPTYALRFSLRFNCVMTSRADPGREGK